MVIQDYVKKHFGDLHSKSVARSPFLYGLSYMEQLTADEMWSETEAIIACISGLEKNIYRYVIGLYSGEKFISDVRGAFADSLQEHLETLESEAEDLPDSKAHEASLINRGDY